MSNGDRLRVLHAVGSMGRGGVETWLMHVLRHTDHDHFQMDFLVHTDEPSAYDDEIRELGGEVIVGPSPSRPRAFSRNFRRVMRMRRAYDVVHSHVHHSSGFVLRLADREGVPIRVAHSHLDTSRLDRAAGPLRKTYLALMHRWIVQFATTGLAASQPAGSSLFGSTWGTDHRWQILRCSVDLEPFTRSGDANAVRAEFGINPDAFVVGHVGRFEEQKNHQFLIKIAAELARLDPEVRILLVGDGSLQSAVERQVSELGLDSVVIFAGSRPDVPRIMVNAMDAFLLPSRFEGLPLVGIEAQAAGLPAIVSNTVSNELDIVPGLVRYLSLDQPAGEWAQEIMDARRSRTRADRKFALETVVGSSFNITNGLTALERIYDGP